MAGHTSVDKKRANQSALMGVEDDINPALRETLNAYQDWQDAADPEEQMRQQSHLDQTLDRMEADDWDGMKTLAGLVDPQVLVGLMHYSAKRADEDLKRRIALMTTEKDYSKQNATKRDRDR